MCKLAVKQAPRGKPTAQSYKSFSFRKCLFAHSVCANFGLNAHSVCANFGLNAHSQGYYITFLR